MDLWQADAQGAYSNARDGYLRGTQLTDAAGRAVFRTIVPGWYAHLAPHIHFKVRPDARTQTSSHFFFPEDLLQQLYARQPYARRTAPKHPNGRDGRYRESGAALTLAPVADGAGLPGRVHRRDRLTPRRCLRRRGPGRRRGRTGRSGPGSRAGRPRG